MCTCVLVNLLAQMSFKKRLFQPSKHELNQILFCDDSNTEDALELDNADIEFLENDVENMQANDSVERMEVVIESASGPQQSTTNSSSAINFSFS